MFTVNITRFIAEECMRDYSASVAELGPNAGRYTWEACTENAPEWNFIPADQLDYFREWLQEWGAWDADEIAAMDVAHLQSMCLQWIAGDARQCGLDKPAPWGAGTATARANGFTFNEGHRMNKQKFTRADGSKGSAPKVSAMPELRPGHWWINQAPIGAGFNHWVETPAPIRKGSK